MRARPPRRGGLVGSTSGSRMDDLEFAALVHDHFRLQRRFGSLAATTLQTARPSDRPGKTPSRMILRRDKEESPGVGSLKGTSIVSADRPDCSRASLAKLTTVEAVLELWETEPRGDSYMTFSKKRFQRYEEAMLQRLEEQAVRPERRPVQRDPERSLEQRPPSSPESIKGSSANKNLSSLLQTVQRATRILKLLRLGQPILRSSKLLDLVLEMVCEALRIDTIEETRERNESSGFPENLANAALGATRPRIPRPPPPVPLGSLPAARKDFRVVLEQILTLPRSDDLDVAEKFVPLMQAVQRRIEQEAKGNRLGLFSARQLVQILKALWSVRYKNDEGEFAEKIVLCKGLLFDPKKLKEMTPGELAELMEYLVGLELIGSSAGDHSSGNAVAFLAESVDASSLILRSFADRINSSSSTPRFGSTKTTAAGSAILWTETLRNYANFHALRSRSLLRRKNNIGAVSSAPFCATSDSAILAAGLQHISDYFSAGVQPASSAVPVRTRKGLLMMAQNMFRFGPGECGECSFRLLRALHTVVDKAFCQSSCPSGEPKKSASEVSHTKTLDVSATLLSPVSGTTAHLFMPDAGRCRVSGPQGDVHKVLAGLPGIVSAQLEVPIVNTTYVVDMVAQQL
ncbi:unnamed protein product [Amoebophrya sp. A120]|nr:unnamed protein product [Amoebophrya sp. A120]|eukprot:GSA120T00022691001.1